MAQPYNYMLDIPNPAEAVNRSLMQGFNMAANIDQAQALREQRAAQQAQQAQMQMDIDETIANPTYETIGKLQIKYPQHHEAFKNAWGTISDGERQSIGSIASQSFAALDNNKPEIAMQFMENAVAGYDNAGQKKNADVARGYLKMIKDNPAAAKLALGQIWLAADENGFKTYGEQNRANEMQPYQIAETEARTGKIQAETSDIPLAAEDRRRNIEQQREEYLLKNDQYYAGLEQNQRQFYDKLDADEKAEARKLAASKVETPEQRMKRMEQVESYAVAKDNAVRAAANAKELASVISEATGGYWNRAMRNLPGMEEYNIAQRVETLKSQIFLNQVDQMRGLGALTEAEGAALKTSISSINLNQGAKEVRDNLLLIEKTLANAAKTAERKAQIYATKGQGYSSDVIEAAKTLGISPAEAQKFVNENGL